MTLELKTIITDIKALWYKCLEKSPEIFRYKLNIEKEKILEGKFNFYVQVRKIKNFPLKFLHKKLFLAQ